MYGGGSGTRRGAKVPEVQASTVVSWSLAFWNAWLDRKVQLKPLQSNTRQSTRGLRCWDPFYPDAWRVTVQNRHPACVIPLCRLLLLQRRNVTTSTAETTMPSFPSFHVCIMCTFYTERQNNCATFPSGTGCASSGSLVKRKPSTQLCIKNFNIKSLWCKKNNLLTRFLFHGIKLQSRILNKAIALFIF